MSNAIGESRITAAPCFRLPQWRVSSGIDRPRSSLGSDSKRSLKITLIWKLKISKRASNTARSAATIRGHLLCDGGQQADHAVVRVRGIRCRRSAAACRGATVLLLPRSALLR